MQNTDNYYVIGLMSGTSLDGLDVAFCSFRFAHGKWTYKIHEAKTYPYSKQWKESLSSVEKRSAEEFAMLHSGYGHFTGKKVNNFLQLLRPSLTKNSHGVFIASHGHTIFHQPEKKFTFQLGSGAAIAAETGLPVICDFRTTDVALGGQGAPLVPVGDKYLFPNYDFCLNIGGIANISCLKNSNNSFEIPAFDICPANMALNLLANTIGWQYDNNGSIAMSGKVFLPLLKELNGLKYYSRKPPKSLGKEWFLKEFQPVLNRYKISIADKLCTVTEHIAFQVKRHIDQFFDTRDKRVLKLLLTGGGAHNRYLTERIRKMTEGSLDVVVPDKFTVNFKEALIFAFLGVLRWRREVNCLSSVTGARRDNCGGAVYMP